LTQENIFCPKCHKLVAEKKVTEERVELRQNGKVLLSLSSQSRGNNIGLRCPSGHNVKVEI
jgi:hypothetical protein